MCRNEIGSEKLDNNFEVSVADLERITSGIRTSDLIIIAASQDISNTTAVALKIGSKVALNENNTVAFFSLELSKNQLIQHMLCLEGGINYQKLNTAELNKSDWYKLENAVNNIVDAPLYIDDTHDITVSDLRVKACRLKQEKGLGLIIIDSLHMLKGLSENKDAPIQEISDLLLSLKVVGNELGVPVIASLQLTNNANKDSICYLEQFADIVTVLN